jgi:hypothetical protein
VSVHGQNHRYPRREYLPVNSERVISRLLIIIIAYAIRYSIGLVRSVCLSKVVMLVRNKIISRIIEHSKKERDENEDQ